LQVRLVVTRAVVLGFISCGLVLVSSEQTTFREGPASESSATILGRDLAAVATSREARAVSQVLEVPASKGERHPKAAEEQRPRPEARAPAATASAAERPRRASRVPAMATSRAFTGKGGRVLVAATSSRSNSSGSAQRGSILRAELRIGDEQLRTSLAGPESTEGRFRTAAIFRSRYPDLQLLEEKYRAVDRQLPSRFDELAEDAADETDDLLTVAYAPAVRPEFSLFDHVLGEPKRSFVPPLGSEDHSWAATPLPASAFAEDEQTCLANGIYFEARGEEEEGQAAVAQVILNRVRNPAYPDTICGVVYQNQSWKNRCQFSFACDGIEDRITDRRAYATAELIGHKVSNGEIWLSSVGSATNYHATYVNPRWAEAMKRVDKIGRHIFYRTFNGGWD